MSDTIGLFLQKRTKCWSAIDSTFGDNKSGFAWVKMNQVIVTFKKNAHSTEESSQSWRTWICLLAAASRLTWMRHLTAKQSVIHICNTIYWRLDTYFFCLSDSLHCMNLDRPSRLFIIATFLSCLNMLVFVIVPWQ